MKLKIPSYVMGSIDPLTHKTEEDIAYLVRHELDLYEEGEETDMTAADARAARRWLGQHPSKNAPRKTKPK